MTAPAPADGWTPERLEAAFHASLGSADMRGVRAALHVMAVRDPRRAERLIGLAQLALHLAEVTAAPPAGPPSTDPEAAAAVLVLARPALTAWRKARDQLAAAYDAVDTAPDVAWRATIAHLVGVRQGALEAARALDDTAAALAKLARGVDVDELVAAAGLQPGDWPDRSGGLAHHVECTIREQDARISEINRSAGRSADAEERTGAAWPG